MLAWNGEVTAYWLFAAVAMCRPCQKDPILSQYTTHFWVHGVVATLNPRHWHWLGVATTSCDQWVVVYMISRLKFCVNAEVVPAFGQNFPHILLRHVVQQVTICITFMQRRSNVFDAGPALHKCYRNVWCLLSNDWCDTQKTRDIHSILFQCWPTVSDAGPTLKQHWVNVPCLLGSSDIGPAVYLR